MRKLTKVVLVGGALAALLILLWIPWSRYTDLGIFVGGGGRYWVGRAAISKTNEETKNHLRRVLAATQYGVNTAENQVAALPDRQTRIRLWRALIELAPNDNWRAIYARRLQQEADPARGAHGG